MAIPKKRLRNAGCLKRNSFFFSRNLKLVEVLMDWHRVEGNWKQARRQIMRYFRKLTKADLDFIAGSRDRLEGKIQERYRLKTDEAKAQVGIWYQRQYWSADVVPFAVKDTAKPAILRRWASKVRTEHRSAYVDYVRSTGGDDYRKTPGNLGFQLLLRDLPDGTTEIETLSWWSSLEAIAAFAGTDYERSRYYPEDDRFLLDKPEHVTHFEVVLPHVN